MPLILPHSSPLSLLPDALAQGTDFCGTQGFDALMKRMKDGKKMCMDFEDYLEKW